VERADCILEHGDLEIYNNAIEREMRPIAIGRKNHLFAGSHEGGKRAAIFYTIINTCKAHKVNPHDYLIDVLKRIRTQPASEIQQLTPARWKLQN